MPSPPFQSATPTQRRSLNGWARTAPTTAEVLRTPDVGVIAPMRSPTLVPAE